MDNDQFRTPGQLLEHLLEAADLPQRVLALILDIHESQVSKLVTGRKPFSAKISLLLEEVLDVRAERFLELQKRHDLERARIERQPAGGRRARARLLSDYPVREMISRGWLDIPDMADLDVVEAELARFFGVNKVEEIQSPAHAARKTNAGSELTRSQLGWLRRVHQIAEGLVVPPYSEVGARRALSYLDLLRPDPERVHEVPRVLAQCGIRYVLVETVRTAKIDGVCLWLNGCSPVIGMTMRFDRVDNFWFVLRHELEHVIRGHGRETPSVDVELDGANGRFDADVPDEERLANRAAAEFCVPQDKLEMFIEAKEPYFSERDVLALSRMVGAHPGLVVGQIQRRTGRYDFLREYLVSVRSGVAGEAVVDGWGSVPGNT